MNNVLLVGIGFLAGTAGVKALKSKPVHKACVKTIAQGMKIKDQCESIVEEAKAEFDDIVAEAEYELDEKDDEADDEPKAEAPKKTRKAKSAKAE